MKHLRVASLFLLYILVCIFLNSCKENVTKKSTSFSLSRKIDSINRYYNIAETNSRSNKERLEAITNFLKGAQQLNVDSLRYNGFILQTKLLNQYGEPKKAIEQSYAFLQLAQKNKDSIHIARALYKLGLYNKTLDHYLEAFDYYNQSFKISRNIKDSINAGKCLMAMSNIQRILGDYNASKTTATDGLKYLGSSNQYKRISGLYQNISLGFKELGNYKEALFWNNKIISLINDTIAKHSIGIHNLPIFLNTRANILTEQKKYQESITILEKLLKDKNVVEDRVRYALILNNLAYVKFLQNPNNLESETMLLDALEIRQQEKDVFGLYSSNLYLCKYHKEKDIEKGKYHAQQAYLTLKDFVDYEALLEILTLIIELDPESLENHQRFKEVSLKLMELRKKTREIYAPTRFENENLLKENEEKNRRIVQVRNQNTIYLLGILLSLTGIAFVVYFFRQRTKYLAQQNQMVQFQASYETETRISKRLHDELGNDIFQVMLQYQNDPHDPRIQAKLNTTYNKARDISRENNEFETDETYGEELSNMLQNYTQNGIQLLVRGLDKIDWNPIDKPVKITVYRVLQELMTNMQKHSKANLVVLRFANTDNTLTIKYSDNGVGMAKEHLQSKNGLRNTEKRVEAIEGTLIFESEKNKGFKAEIQIPN